MPTTGSTAIAWARTIRGRALAWRNGGGVCDAGKRREGGGAGDTVIVRGGTYREALSVAASGKRSSRSSSRGRRRRWRRSRGCAGRRW
jgi:hypothetical protein